MTGVEQILDPIVTTLEAYYQKPQCLAPLDPDPDTNGKPSDHRIVVVKPVTESGLCKMRFWLQSKS